MLRCKGLSVIFLMMCTFSYGHLILVSFTSWYMRRIKSTMVIWHIAGKPYNWLNFIWSKTWMAIFNRFPGKTGQGSPDHRITGSPDQGSKITGSRITRSRITRSRITGSRITRSRITGSRITGSRITGSRITRSRITGSRITGSRIKDQGSKWIK